MEVTIEKGKTLVIRIPLCDPRPSTSGKTLTVATSGGNQATTCIHPDLKQPIKVGVNAYCPK